MAQNWYWRTKNSEVKTTGEIGSGAEQFAQRYLRREGLKVIATNVSYAFGEIDIIARDGNELVFVEVRFRTGSSHGTAAASVTDKKQKHLILAAQKWLADNQSQQNRYCRFDLIAIDSVVDSEHTIWEKNAFQTQGY